MFNLRADDGGGSGIVEPPQWIPTIVAMKAAAPRKNFISKKFSLVFTELDELQTGLSGFC